MITTNRCVANGHLVAVGDAAAPAAGLVARPNAAAVDLDFAIQVCDATAAAVRTRPGAVVAHRHGVQNHFGFNGLGEDVVGQIALNGNAAAPLRRTGGQAISNS